MPLIHSSVSETETSHVFVVGDRLVVVTLEAPLTVVTTDPQVLRRIFGSMSETPMAKTSSAIAMALGALWTIASALLLALVGRPSKLLKLTTLSESGRGTS